MAQSNSESNIREILLIWQIKNLERWEPSSCNCEEKRRNRKSKHFDRKAATTTTITRGVAIK